MYIIYVMYDVYCVCVCMREGEKSEQGMNILEK